MREQAERQAQKTATPLGEPKVIALGTTENFGRSVRIHRSELGMTQTALANSMAAAGFPWHPSTVSKIESGDRDCTVAELVALGGILEVGPEAILTLASSLREHERADAARVEIAEDMLNRARAAAQEADEIQSRLIAMSEQHASAVAEMERQLSALRFLAAELRSRREEVLRRVIEGSGDDAQDQ